MIQQRVRLFRHVFRNVYTHVLRTKKPVFGRINGLSNVGSQKVDFPSETGPKFSELSTGMRVITSENKNRIASLGVIIKMGSRFESKSSLGSSRVLFDMILSTGQSSQSCLADKLALNGLMLAGGFNREYTSFVLEYLRGQGIESSEDFFDGIFKFYKRDFNDDELEMVKRKTKEELSLESENPSIVLNELLHSTAWKGNSLGNNQVLSLDHISRLSSKNLTEFRDANLLSRNTIVVGIGVNHDQLVKKIMDSSRKFGLPEMSGPSSLRYNEYKIEAPKYVGGLTINKISGHGFTDSIVAFETNLNWKGRELVALSVLQAYLGGGSSFSVGGPGKGMYSKLFLDVLNKLDWVESCNSFVHQYSDKGLFGIHVTSYPGYSLESIKAIGRQLGEMKNINERELERAKNLVLSTIYSTYENKGHYMEEISKQILSHSEYIELDEIIDCVKNISIEDVKKITDLILSNASRPTVIVVGTDTDQIPDYNGILSIISRHIGKWFAW